MYAPRPPMASNETNIPRESLPHKKCAMSLRHCLLVWAYLRLAYSIFWSGVVLIATVQVFRYYDKNDRVLRDDPLLFLFGPVAFMTQIVEMVMIVTFIVACHKKSPKLFRIYFYYCVTTLITYIIATSVFLLFQSGSESLHFLVENYMVYHTMEVNVLPPKYDGLTFIIGVIVDICLQILLIYLLKKLIIKNRSRDDDYCSPGKNANLRTGEEVPTNV